MKKKAAAKKKAVAPAVEQTAEELFESATGFADFPCERATAEARRLWIEHGEAFITWLQLHPGAVPVSLLTKVARIECAGGTMKLKANKSFKDRGKK